MNKNRKRTRTYRFNGNPYFHTGSIHPVRIADLQKRIEELEAKLTAPDDPDDRRWTARWLDRHRRELAKKLKGLALKQRDHGSASGRES